MRKNLLCHVSAAALFVGHSLIVPLAVARPMHGGGIPVAATTGPDPEDTCPKGKTYVVWDGCELASPTAQFKNPNLVATYALSADGQSQTIYHAAPYNIAGQDFGVGMTTPLSDKKDPRDFSVVGAGDIINNNTVRIGSITNGGVPKPGMYVWDRPAGGTQYYAAGQAPKIVSCADPVGGTYNCLLDRTVTNRGGHIIYASMWYGCVDLIAGVDWDGAAGDQSKQYDQIYCDFRSSASTAKAEIENITFGPINGHNATILTAISHNSTTSMGEIELTNIHATFDQYTYGNAIMSAGIASPNIRFKLKDFECDGRNGNSPLAGPFDWPLEGNCFNWDSPGSVTWGFNQVQIINGYVHDWSGRPMSTQAGNTDTLVQNLYVDRINLNCGDDTPPDGTSNGCHGTIIAHGTTIRGSDGSLILRNITAHYPFGQRNGVITGALSIQGGIGSAVTMDVEMSGMMILANTGNVPGKSVLSVIARVARVGEISNLKIQHMYANSPGIYQCFGIGGDLQANASSTGIMVANSASDRSSTITFSGFASNSTLPFPGQVLVAGLPSQATQFRATLTDRGDGKSNLHIDSGAPGFTISAGNQIVALKLADLQAFPTLIESGSGSDYVVDNGSGSGESRASQVFHVGQVLMPFGTIDPATGTPSTAVGGSSHTGYNGTWVARGLKTLTPSSPSNWSALAPHLGNAATIDTDSHDLWMMNIAGDAGKITLEGIDLGSGLCPGTQPP
jgi:hypothetical protein